jgi:2'-5' RNA ligase
LFFALYPPPPLSLEIFSRGAYLKHAHHLAGRMIDPPRIHLTLASVYNFTEPWADQLERAMRVGRSMRQQSFSLELERTQSFAHGGYYQPFVMCGEDGTRCLKHFQKALAEEMRRSGFKIPHGFTPHVTMLWADRRIDENPMLPVCWTATDFVLIKSIRGHSQHTELGRWRLH